MNFNWFIAKKIIFQRTLFKGYSKSILIIGISAIAIGITSMLIALGTGTGLQKKISEKILSELDEIIDLLYHCCSPK